MPTVIDPKAYILGAADIYYRAVGVATAWTSVGATLDDAVATITTTRFVPDNLSGVMGPVMGLDYLRKVEATVEFTMPEIAGAKLGLAIPGTRITAPVVTESGSATISTTLYAATVVGATNIKVASVGTLAAGQTVGIDVVAGSLREYRVIDTVGTVNGGTGLTFRDPLKLAHASGVVVIQTDGDGRTLYESPIVRRLPDSEYREWALVAFNGNGYQELRFPRAVSTTDSAQITFGDAVVAAIKVTLGARYTGTDLTLSPFKLFASA